MFNFQSNKSAHHFCKTELYNCTQPSLTCWEVTEWFTSSSLARGSWTNDSEDAFIWRNTSKFSLSSQIWDIYFVTFKKRKKFTFLSKMALMVIINPQDMLCACNLRKKHRDLKIHLQTPNSTSIFSLTSRMRLEYCHLSLLEFFVLVVCLFIFGIYLLSLLTW